MLAILRVTRLAAGGRSETAPPEDCGRKDYYDAALILLSQLAEHEIKPHDGLMQNHVFILGFRKKSA